MSAPDHPVMEFALSYPVNVRSVAPKGFHAVLKTDEKERQELARNHGLLAVDAFSADFYVRPWKKRGIRIEGAVKALITQKCVVTAEPVEKIIEQNVDVIYISRDSRLAKCAESRNIQELFLDAEGPDAPEIFEGDEIDVGAVAEEFFELAIDPYPRKAGVSFAPSCNARQDDGGQGKDSQASAGESKDGQDQGRSPFAVLRHLKRP